MSNGYFYDVSNFRDTFTAMNIALENHYADMLFQGDNTRIVYSSTEYALRKRAKDHSNLNLPFMNYRIDDISNGTERNWFNHQANVDGIFVPELQQKIRVNPVTISYDSTIFYHKYLDTVIGQYNLLWDDANETNLRSAATIVIGGEEVVLPGFLGYNMNFTPTYNENDWLERNNINTITVNFQVETFIILDNVDISIPDTVIFNFLVRNQVDTTQVEDTYQATIDHFNEEVSNFTLQP